MSDVLSAFDDLTDSGVNQKKYWNRKVLDPVQFQSDGNPDLWFLVDEPLTEQQLYILKQYMRVSHGGTSYAVVSSLKFQPTAKDLEKRIVEFYSSNSFDLTQIIPAWSRIIPMGRALYSITRSDDLLPNDFYDFVFNRTHFFDPRTSSYIYPVDSFQGWFHRDTFKWFFADRQIKQAIAHEPRRFRSAKPTLTFVEEPTEFLRGYIGVEADMAWDLETKGLDPWAEDGHIICLTLTFDGKTAYYLPFDKIDVSVLSDFFKGKRGIGSNLKFDVKWLSTHGVDRDNLDIKSDTVNLGHALNEMRKNGLKTAAWLYTNFGGYDYPLDEYQRRFPAAKSDYSLIPFDIMFPYATMDAIVAWQSEKAMQLQLSWIDQHFPMDNGWSLRRYYEDRVMPTVNMFVDVELEGMPLNIEKLREASEMFQKEVKKREAAIYEAFGVDPSTFSVTSQEQLGSFLESQGWPAIERGAKGFAKTNADILNTWKDLGYKEAQLILDYREVATLLGTFIGIEDDPKKQGFFQYLKKDGRVHPTFAPMLASSGRSKCSNPNLSNIPKHGEKAKVIRGIFSPPSDDFVIAEDDGAGLQLRIGAILSDDPVMRRIFTELSGDMHSMTAQAILKRDLSLEEFMSRKKEPEIKETRFKAKAINFGFEFGSTAFSFARQTLEKEWSVDEAIQYAEENDLVAKAESLTKRIRTTKGTPDGEMFDSISDPEAFGYYWAVAGDIRAKFFEKYSGLHHWIEEQIAFAEANGYVRSPYGAIRRLPELLYQGRDDRPSHVKNLKNIALNSPVQNVEGVVMFWTMTEVNRRIKENGLKSRIVSNVHDAIVSFKHRDEIRIVTEWEKEVFEEDLAINNGIPLLIETEIADYWRKGQTWGFGDEFELDTLEAILNAG